MTEMFSKRTAEETTKLDQLLMIIRKKKVKFADSVIDNEQAPAVEPRVDMNVDYSGWIASKRPNGVKFELKLPTLPSNPHQMPCFNLVTCTW